MFDFTLLIPITFFFSVVAIIKIVIDAGVRRRLAETHASGELIKNILESDQQLRRLSALKWGLVLVLTGLSFGLIDLLGLRPENPSSYGLLMGAAGLGLLAFHVIGHRTR